MAKRDLDAALQLLAERAQHVTGASGAAIALRQGETMVCRASSGPSGPKVGAPIEVSSGLSGESVRTRQVLHCHDAASDPRVNGKSCQERGIVSAMVMPLVREQELVGVFELLSGKAHAFEERDIAALERLGEMIQTAVDHAEAANRAQSVITMGGDAASLDAAEFALLSTPRSQTVMLPPLEVRPGPASDTEMAPSPRVERGNIGKCTACGFPVSEGRTLCLDCDTSEDPDVRPAADLGSVPAFLSQLDLAEAEKENWVRAHKYLIGTILVAAATVGVALWLR
jgi:putative methionine-R-sulfoxide reductase with GAF domain